MSDLSALHPTWGGSRFSAPMFSVLYGPGLISTSAVRMSWMLTSTSILRHHASGHISHTPVSLLLRETEPMGSMFKVM